MSDVITESIGNINMIDVPMWMQAPAGEAAYPYSVNALRFLMRGYRATAPAGVGSGTDFTVTPGGARTLNIAKGLGVVTHSDSVEERTVFGSFGTVTTNIPAHTSGTQTHRLVAEALDTQRSGISGDSRWQFRVIEGTGGTTPAEPPNAITLATVVDTGQINIVAANIVDWRAPFDNTSPTCAVTRAGSDTLTGGNVRRLISFTAKEDDPFNLWSAADPTKINIRHKGTYNLMFSAGYPYLGLPTDYVSCGISLNGYAVGVADLAIDNKVGTYRGAYGKATVFNQLLSAGSYLQCWDEAGSNQTRASLTFRLQRVEHRA